ncbi:MAG: hypothetical protein LUE98_08030 [Tannerellaceae bacterium]|nr:hypothetical protein [Tannerellaceae bacterium]
MKRIIVTLTLLSFLFQSCDKKNNDPEETFTTVGIIKEMNIKNIINEINIDIDNVVLAARVHVPAEGATTPNTTNEDGIDLRYMFRIPFDNNGMTIQFPENPPEVLLVNIEKDFPEGFTISNLTARTISFVEIGFCYAGSDRIAGKLDFRKDTDDIHYEVVYLYSDRLVSITGTAPDWWGQTTTYNINLEKGWNMIIQKTEYIDTKQYKTYPHQQPYGMAWYYNMWIGGRG